MPYIISKVIIPYTFDNWLDPDIFHSRRGISNADDFRAGRPGASSAYEFSRDLAVAWYHNGVDKKNVSVFLFLSNSCSTIMSLYLAVLPFWAFFSINVLNCHKQLHFTKTIMCYLGKVCIPCTHACSYPTNNVILQSENILNIAQCM